MLKNNASKLKGGTDPARELIPPQSTLMITDDLNDSKLQPSRLAVKVKEKRNGGELSRED